MIAEDGGSEGKGGGRGGGKGERAAKKEGGAKEAASASAFSKARVKRIMRLCPDTRTVSAESIFVVGKMTEEFVKHLAQESKKIADKDSRKTLRPNDIYEAVVNNKRKLGFLEDCFGPLLSDQLPASVARKSSKSSASTSILDSSAKADAGAEADASFTPGVDL